ncbi:hypothetical protein ACFQ7F_05950 [Streptomyces sp. NPDC056486]|uniref:hypothetical protein n=1 Tax=Streptomyces sp. NPDC056486 TaxID=3345835 RepID=UPI003687CFA8
MTNRGRTLKITAALVLSALALTGFTTGRGHGGGSRHSSGSGGGGGCSSSKQDHDSSSSSSSGSSGSTTSGSGYDDDEDSYGSSGDTSSSTSGGSSYNRRPTHRSTSSSSPGGEQMEDAKATLVTCASKTAPYATVKVTNGNEKKGRFWVSVTFLDEDGLTIIEESEKVKVPGKGKTTARVELSGEGLAASVDHCEVDPQAISVSG